MLLFVSQRQLSMRTRGQLDIFAILTTWYIVTLPSYQKANMIPQRSGADNYFNNNFSQGHCATGDVFIPPDASKGRASESNPESPASRLLN
jgi:hypothetical protein